MPTFPAVDPIRLVFPFSYVKPIGAGPVKKDVSGARRRMFGEEEKWEIEILQRG